MNEAYTHYTIVGYRMQIAPANWRPVEIAFVVNLRSIRILGAEIYNDQHIYLGHLYPHNISLEQVQSMILYIRSNPKKWIRDTQRMPFRP